MNISSKKTIIEKTHEWLGEKGIDLFRGYRAKYGTVSPVFYEKGATIPHPVHFREGMQVRNFLRRLPECKGWNDHEFDDRWQEIIEMVIDQ